MYHREAEGNTLLLCETIKGNTASVTASVLSYTIWIANSSKLKVIPWKSELVRFFDFNYVCLTRFAPVCLVLEIMQR